jgi:flavin-binding protein dodecin
MKPTSITIPVESKEAIDKALAEALERSKETNKRLVAQRVSQQALIARYERKIIELTEALNRERSRYVAESDAGSMQLNQVLTRALTAEKAACCRRCMFRKREVQS